MTESSAANPIDIVYANSMLAAYVLSHSSKFEHTVLTYVGLTLSLNARQGVVQAAASDTKLTMELSQLHSAIAGPTTRADKPMVSRTLVYFRMRMFLMFQTQLYAHRARSRFVRKQLQSPL